MCRTICGPTGSKVQNLAHPAHWGFKCMVLQILGVWAAPGGKANKTIIFWNMYCFLALVPQASKKPHGQHTTSGSLWSTIIWFGGSSPGASVGSVHVWTGGSLISTFGLSWNAKFSERSGPWFGGSNQKNEWFWIGFNTVLIGFWQVSIGFPLVSIWV